MQFLCQYTTFSIRVSKVECLFLRSAEIFSNCNGKFQQQMTVLGDTLGCPELGAGHISVTVLTTNTLYNSN